MSHRRKKTLRLPSSPSPSTSSVSAKLSKSTDTLDCDETDQKKLIEKLRAANAGLHAKNKALIEDNTKKTIKIGMLLKEKMELFNQVNKLHLELGFRNTHSDSIVEQVKLLHSKYVMLSEDIVQIVVNSQRRTVQSELLLSEANEATTSKAVAFNMSHVQQQTQAVKPMISGHTIQSPVINLPRVSPEQLERLSGRMRQDNAEDNSDTEWLSDDDVSDDVEADENAEALEAEVDDVDMDIEPDNEDEQPMNEAINDNNQLVPVEEEEGTIDPEQLSPPSALTTIEEASESNNSTVVSRSLRTRTRHDSVAPLTVGTIAGASENNSSSVRTPAFDSFGDTSLVDISNTRAHVTMRRGRAPKRRNITAIHLGDESFSPVDESNTEETSPVEESNAEETASNSPPEDTHSGTNGVPLSNTLFVEELGSTTSTPALPRNSRSKRPKTIAEANENANESLARRSSLTRHSGIRPCTVVLKRIVSTPKRKSKSPRKRSNVDDSPIKSSSSASSTSTDASQMSQVSSGSSPRTRPLRRAKPKTLKEVGLKKKMRRL